MATKRKLDHIEEDQGVTDDGVTFGYDHRRLNFIQWAIDPRGRLIVAKVENDEQETRHGSVAATLRDARSVAARENRLPGSLLLRSIQRARAAAGCADRLRDGNNVNGGDR